MPSLRPVTETQPRAIIYLRQSITRDDSISLELQEIACRDYCDRMGYAVTRVEADPGISGRTWKRPAVQRVMDAIETHAADVIVLWKWSRLSRNRKDWALAVDRVDIAGGRIESATEPIDTATASGRFARGVMTEYAAFQSEQIGEQWEEVRQRRLHLGLPVSGRLPYGWRWAEGGIEQHPEQAPHVVEMFRRYLSGQGSAEIARWLNTAGIPGPTGGEWSRVRPFTIMDSPIHAGLIPYRDEVYEGAHEPLIDRATWDAYRAERADRARRGERPRQYEHLLSTLVRCSCGAKMHGKASTTGGKVYGGYICERSGAVQHPARAYVSAMTLDPLVEDWLLRFDPLVDTTAPLDAADDARRERLNREAAQLHDELAELTRQLARNVVPEVAYLRARERIERELEPIETELARLGRDRRTAPTPAAMHSLRTAWDEMSLSRKNQALRTLIAQIDVADDGRTAKLWSHWGRSSVLHF